MTIRIIQTLLLLLASAAGSALADHSEEFAPIVQIFSGLAYGDQELVKQAITPDFLLLEMGEVWDREFLLTLVQPNSRERSNYFSVISVNRFEGATLINYWNKATIITDGKESTRAWLESAVAVQTAAGWKLQQMHSTRIKPEQIPEDVELELLMMDRAVKD
ncbi:MAG: hypothetical protein NWQ45_13505 [Congregibacter sp.]|nr:hypothetical protein [Congregibacter sp.]